MTCINKTVALQSKEKGVVCSGSPTPSSLYTLIEYTFYQMLSKSFMCRSRLPIPVPNWILLGELCPKGISDPFKRLKQAINATYRLPYDVMMVISNRKKLIRGNGGAFKNAGRLYSNEICFPLNRIRYALGSVSGVYGKRTIA